jgi:hypothetical protein
MKVITSGVAVALALSASTTSMTGGAAHGPRIVAPPCAHVPSLAVSYLSVTNLGSKKNPRLGVIYVAVGGGAKEQMTQFTMPRQPGQTATYRLHRVFKCSERPDIINH